MDTKSTERIILEESFVRVTNKRLIIPNQTYSIAGITSIRFVYLSKRMGTKGGNLTLIGIATVVASFALFAVLPCPGIIAVIIGGSIICMGAVQPKISRYALAIRTSGGELQVFESEDEQFMRRIVRAIEIAISDE